jgi:DNA adenine methylase
MNNSSNLSPFIKWPGGKSTELKIIKQYSTENINRYFETFLGGGSVFFDFKFKKSFVNDISIELMSLYKLIKDALQKIKNMYFQKTNKTKNIYCDSIC